MGRDKHHRHHRERLPPFVPLFVNTLELASMAGALARRTQCLRRIEAPRRIEQQRQCVPQPA